jgi:hypothetical protein
VNIPFTEFVHDSTLIYLNFRYLTFTQPPQNHAPLTMSLDTILSYGLAILVFKYRYNHLCISLAHHFSNPVRQPNIFSAPHSLRIKVCILSPQLASNHTSKPSPRLLPSRIRLAIINSVTFLICNTLDPHQPATSAGNTVMSCASMSRTMRSRG